jgi:hypothetical protein
MNNHRRDGYFSAHYFRMFDLRLPHQDAVADLLRSLGNELLEQAKMALISALFEQKWLRGGRLLGKYYMVAVDATGIVSYKKRHCEHCLTKKSKKGEITYFHYVLEAKLVTHWGLALSLACEWIENPSGEFNKQDCERSAFIRLALKLKKQYPRLAICILADGLYPYENAFKICEQNAWKFIFVLKENSLKSVQEELTLTRRNKPQAEYYTAERGWRIKKEYKYQSGIAYHKKYRLNWIQCIETRNKMIPQGEKTIQNQPPPETSCFEYVTNLEPDKGNVHAIASGGRLRWKIENEGFNIQKCGDYELEHKFDRNSYNGLKNYYTLLQIAHAINQLVEKGDEITYILKLRPKETIRNLWNKLKHYMIFFLPLINDDPPEMDNSIRPAPS